MAFRTNKTPVLQEKSASGSVATFNTALAMPLPSCNIAVNAWQEGSGDPSPSNVRAIHGFSEVNAYQRAVNLWDEEWELGTYRSSSGEPSSSNSNIRSKSTSYISVTPNTTYYFYTNGYTMNVYQYASDKSYIGYFSVANESRQVNVNCYYLRFYIWSAYGATYNNDISINYPSTDTDYHAYTGNTYTIQLGQEVYGAEVDVVNGVVHVDMGYYIFNGSEGNWVYRDTSNSFYRVMRDMKKLSYSTEGKCNKFTTVRSLTDYGITFGASNSAIYFNAIIGTIPEVTDLETWKTWLSNNNVQVIYPLATPFDIQLTPTQIETLIGNNTIFADTGDIDLTYKDLDIAKRGNFREVFKLPS